MPLGLLCVKTVKTPAGVSGALCLHEKTASLQSRPVAVSYMQAPPPPPPRIVDTPIACNMRACSADGVCCGQDPIDHQFYCASHCYCANKTTSVVRIGCWCDDGFHGLECSQEVSPTVWLAVILSVGTLLVLLIAWGFRCQEELDETTLNYNDNATQRGRPSPLLREGGAAALAAATARDATECPSSTDVSCTGVVRATSDAGHSLTGRRCCVCLAKPLQVVLIPCGHACTCRRCSRQLDRCPLCRLEIQATQRVFF